MFVFVLVMALFGFCYSKAEANDLCSSVGYSIFTINGIFNDEVGAIKNRDKLKSRFSSVYNNQPLSVDYLYNPTHLAGVGDFIDAIQQGVFNQKSDYDLTEILNGASQKVTTQKLLLIAHSQGNFYANNFYDKVASQEGGIPKESLGVYGVGSPANNVAGGGKYLTSDTDNVIATLVARYIKILTPNIHISLSGTDGNGHSFSDVYLKYEGDKIVSDIKSSLKKLKENDEQISSEPCISAPKLTLGHKIIKGVLVIADPAALIAKKRVINIYDTGSYLVKGIRNAGVAVGKTLKGLSANVVESLPDSGGLTTIVVDALEPNVEVKTEQMKEPAKDSPSQEVVFVEKVEAPEVPDASRRSGGGRSSSGENNPDTEIISDPIPDPDPVPDPIPDPVPDPIPDPVPTCVDPQILVDNVCVDPIPESVPEELPEEDPILPPPAELETITISENTTLLAGEYDYENLIITNNAILILEGDPSSTDGFKGVKINVVNLTITEGASISADQKGYGSNQGPGAVPDTSAVSNSGAGYGGASSSAQDALTYGSATKPIDLGSGGAGLNHGGGAIYVVVSDTMKNDGVISSSGGASSSGGSIYVKARKIEGDGIFRANGGDLFASGYFKSPGGGGRVALYYDDWSFDGIVEAKGGCGSYDSYTKVCSGDGTAGAFDVPENDIYAKGSWKFIEEDGPFNFNHIFLSGAKVEIEDGVEITVDDIVLDEASVLVLSGEEIINADNLLVSGNSIITVTPEKILSLIISNITVDSGSMISADEKGYMNGPGTEETFTAGASYGGKGGGATAKPSYGSATEPVDFGSGTPSHRGGGAIYLEVENNLQNDGIISATGIKNHVSGGSIYVRTDELSGGGIFQAYGGSSSWPYGLIAGSGGRIAMYYKNLSFSGATSVVGGSYCFSGCNPAAEAGTLVMVDETIVTDTEEPDSEPEPDPDPVSVCVSPQILVDNVCTDPEPEPEPIPTCIDPQILVDNVCVDPEPEPVPDISIPLITNYSLNETEDDVTINSLTDITSLVFTANKNVDWVSIKIEKEDDESIFKSFRESADCADGTDVCTKMWNSLLAGDTTAPNGTYKVKVRIRDLSDNTKDYDYFSPYTITIDIREDVPIVLE